MSPRPKKPFDRNRLSEENKEKVYQLACQGIDSFIIAQELNVGKPLLMSRCRDQLQLGYEKAIESGILKTHPLIRGPKSIDFTPEMKYQTEKLAGLGIPIRQIADILGVTESWLSNIGMDIIDLGRAKAHAKVAESLYNMATDEEHPSMTTFYLKTQCGWKEATQIEFPDEHGVPQQLSGPTTVVNIEKMQVLIDKLNEAV